MRERIKKGELLIGTIDTWIVWNLTKGSKDVLTPERNGAHVTDYSNASRTMLFNIHKLDWDDELLEIQGGIPKEALPIPRPFAERNAYGYTGPEVAKLMNGISVPVTAIIGTSRLLFLGKRALVEVM